MPPSSIYPPLKHTSLKRLHIRQRIDLKLLQIILRRSPSSPTVLSQHQRPPASPRLGPPQGREPTPVLPPETAVLARAAHLVRPRDQVPLPARVVDLDHLGGELAPFIFALEV